MVYTGLLRLKKIWGWFLKTFNRIPHGETVTGPGLGAAHYDHPNLTGGAPSFIGEPLVE